MRANPPVDDLDGVRALVETMGPGFHPDTPGAEYETGDGPLFSDAEADQYDAALAQAAEVAAAAGTDLYAVAVGVADALAAAERFELLEQRVASTGAGRRHDGWSVTATGLTRAQVAARLRGQRGVGFNRVRRTPGP